MSCQRESEGSPDGASEGEAGEGCTGEVCSVSVEGMRNLISGVPSDDICSWSLRSARKQ